MQSPVYVRWVDSSAVRESGWLDKDDAESYNHPDVAETLAFIVAESDESITIAHSVIGTHESRANESMMGTLTIPKAAITHRVTPRFTRGYHRARKATQKR